MRRFDIICWVLRMVAYQIFPFFWPDIVKSGLRKGKLIARMSVDDARTLVNYLFRLRLFFIIKRTHEPLDDQKRSILPPVASVFFSLYESITDNLSTVTVARKRITPSSKLKGYTIIGQAIEREALLVRPDDDTVYIAHGKFTDPVVSKLPHYPSIYHYLLALADLAILK